MNSEEIMQKQYSDAMENLIEYQKKVVSHNIEIIKDFDCEDLQDIFNDIDITGKIDWVDKPKFKAEKPADKYGIFTLEFIDQRSVGMEGDSFEGYIYIKIKGYKKYLKVPYSC
jgi:hypothetical protein